MATHYHLLTEKANLPVGMRQLNGILPKVSIGGTTGSGIRIKVG